MAWFTIEIDSDRPASLVYARLVEWDAHSAAIPLTCLHHEGQPAAGQTFVARTGLGPFGFDDPMRVDVLRPPGGDRVDDPAGAVEVTKTGRVVAGRVTWTVTPTPDGSRVEWRQNLLIGRLPRLFDPAISTLGRLAYLLGLPRILR